jgi:AraC-like DNA-binding protein
VLPLVKGLERRGGDPAPVLASFRIGREQLADSEHFVPASSMYSLVEGLAEASGDPYFGVREGERLEPWAWPPMIQASEVAVTVGDFLVRFIMAAGRDASSMAYQLETNRERSCLRGNRVSDCRVRPRHNDSFGVALFLGIIQRAVGTAWDGQRVLASVCDPKVLPPAYLGIRLAQANSNSFSVSFPSEWLLLKSPFAVNPGASGAENPRGEPAGSITEALRQVVGPHLHEPTLDTERIAALFDLSKRTLARRLQQQGTSVSAELAALRRARAEDLLRGGELSISEVGARVGYLEAAVFSRAFRRWTGLTPTEYRTRSRGGD